MHQNGFCVTIGLAVVWLLLFGLWYARRIYRQPFRPGLTWLSVVLGCEATLVGMAILFWGTLRFLFNIDTWLAALVAICIPHAAFILTGAPMILYQIYKDGCFADAALEMTKGQRHNGRDAEKDTP